MNEKTTLSITQLNTYARDLLEGSFMPVWVIGEVGTLTIARSGHVYLTLKDAKANVRAVYFSGADAIRAHQIETGSKVEVFGQISLYVPGGEFQFKVQMLKPIGQGSLQQRFEEIKQQLFEEGLFAQERKKQIPEFARRIGIITSPEGAALQDFINVLTRRFPPVHLQLYPSLVQGKSAHKSLIRGIEYFNRHQKTTPIDAIILTRGGGSIEDLWPFNEISLARTIADSSIPIITAIGHEIDFTIADFVSDLRAPTPSAAAELLIEPFEHFQQRIQIAQKQLSQELLAQIQKQHRKVDFLNTQLEKSNPKNQLNIYAQHIDHLQMKLHHHITRRAEQLSHRLSLASRALFALSPQGVLDRGFAYLEDEKGKLIDSIKLISSKSRIQAHLKDGTIILQKSDQ